MTTPNEELRKQLQQIYKSGELYYRVISDTTDLPQSQAERIATLEDDVEYLQEDIDAMCNAIPSYRWSGGAAELIAKCFADRDTLRAQLADAELHTKQVERGLDKALAQLAEIEKAEPVGYIDEMGKPRLTKDKRLISLSVSGGCEPLYPHPMPAESKDAERYRWLRDYLISPSTHFDDLIVSADKADTLDGVIDAAIAKGAK